MHSSCNACRPDLQVQFWAPAAGGAGVSLIMAYLNGNAIPDLLSVRSLLTKWVGTACGVCANIALGPEAPTIHMGACVAHNITHLACGEATAAAPCPSFHNGMLQGLLNSPCAACCMCRGEIYASLYWLSAACMLLGRSALREVGCAAELLAEGGARRKRRGGGTEGSAAGRAEALHVRVCAAVSRLRMQWIGACALQPGPGGQPAGAAGQRALPSGQRLGGAEPQPAPGRHWQ
jgi:hypothetical protein